MKFRKEQRVAVPGQGITQGVILDAVETVPGFPIYAIRWLDSKGETHTGSVGELNLEIHNPSIIPPGSPGSSVRLDAPTKRKPAVRSKRPRKRR